MKKITLGPYDIHINKTRFEDNTFGEYKSFPSPVIMIDDRLSPKIESLTILHEIIEAIIDITSVITRRRDSKRLLRGKRRELLGIEPGVS